MVLEFVYQGGEHFLKQIQSIAGAHREEIAIWWEGERFFLEFESQEFAKALEKELFNSIYFERVQGASKPQGEPFEAKLPSNVALCPRCIQEMLDPSSRRFYYPFTMCNACGSQASFLVRYPFRRSNTLLSVIKPCAACEAEGNENPYRKDFALISCTRCNIPVRLSDKRGKLLWANESEEYEKIFALAAEAIEEGKSVSIKTSRGYKRFFKEFQEGAKALILRPSDEFLLLGLEKRALFSIERPLVYLSQSDGRVIEAAAVWDGMTLLLGSKLKADTIYFDEKEADLTIDYDLPIRFYEAPRLFINKHHKLLKVQSDQLFPKRVQSQKTALFGEWLEYDGLIDKVECFEEVATDRIYVFKEEPIEHSKVVRLDIAKAFIQKVAKQEGLQSAVGVWFGDEVKFALLQGGAMREIFSFGKVRFEGEKKVAKRFRERFRDRMEAFESEKNFLLKAARLLGVDGDFEAFNLLAHHYGGKGGVSVDCKVSEDGFDWESFYSSIMSFVLAEAKEELIAYSIFESLGEFLSSQAVEVQRKMKAQGVVLAGKYICNSPFFSRFSRNVRDVKYPKGFWVDEVVEV
ncbi:MAG: hypothetical protein C6H99_04050 [Epsilonproteobacteria bacterium]|nr:hypothetical protein [Campylobacterota bacterium]NPA64493.1 hypothetical protein [Campylobacterota bacterium]